VIRASFGKTPAGRLLLGAGVLALLIPAVAGCEAGENAPTLQFHAAASGAQTVFNGIKITNAFVLGAPTGSSVPAGSSASLFVSIYNGNSSGDALQSVSAAGWAKSVTVTGGTVQLPAGGAPVNLTGPTPNLVLDAVSQPLNGGSTIPVTFSFERAGSVTLQVPVEAQSYQWSTFSPPAATQSGAAAISPSTATPVPSAATPSAPTGSTTAKPTATATRTGTATATPTP
jgi:copper(I)-binding protein